MDGVEYLISDHRSIESLFEQYKAVPTTSPDAGSSRRRLVNEMIRELSIHTVIEEQYLYPLCKKVILEDNEGEKLSEHGLKEHRKLKQVLDDLLNLDENSEEFDKEVQTLIKKTIHHHGDEEKDIFPLLRKNATHTQLVDFAVHLAQAKKLAPTHPHPMAPDQPPFNSFVAPLLHAIDKVLDSGRAFPGDGTLTTTHTDKKEADVDISHEAKSTAPSI